MRAKFDVLEEPWIPVTDMDGNLYILGIRETLKRSSDLLEISCASPLEEYSIYRFLGIFLMDAIRPETRLDIESFLEDGVFDMDVIDKYIKTCREEGVTFDLFDTERPFLQALPDASFETKVKPISAIDYMLPSGNNHTHFGHVEDIPTRVAPGAAMRLMLVTYLFCLAGAQGYPSGVYGAPPFFGVIKGVNLFETLTYTLYPIQFIGIPFDTPPVLWRRKTRIQPKEAVGSTSWLQGMLFPARRIRLVCDNDGMVVGVYLCQGENFVNTSSWKDPYVFYHKGKESLILLRPNGEMAIWRNLCDIVNVHDHLSSQLLAQYCSILGSKRKARLNLYGVETNQASYLDVYRYTLEFPVRLTESEEVVQTIGLVTNFAEELARILKKCLEKMGIFSTSSISTAVQNYYQTCEDRFWALCNRIQPESCKLEYISFCEDVSGYAKDTFREILKSIYLRARDMVATEEQSHFFYGTILKKLKEVKNDRRDATGAS